MNRRTQIIVAAAVLVGIVALSAAKRGGRGDGGKCDGGGACCPMLSGLNVWSTNAWAGSAATNGSAGAVGGGAATNQEQ